jgi:hypothetical protein
MGKVIPKGWSCTACEKIWGQPRVSADPHEFLVLRRPGASAIYQCLVCHSNTVCELLEAVPRWRALAGPTGGTHDVAAHAMARAGSSSTSQATRS